GGVALRQACAHGGLRPNRQCREPRVLHAPPPIGGGRRRRGRRSRAGSLPASLARAGHRAQAARAHRRGLCRRRRYHRTRPRRPWLKPSLPSAAISVTYAPRSIVPSRASATEKTCACSRAPRTTERGLAASRTNQHSSTCASLLRRASPHARFLIVHSLWSAR